MKSGVTHKKPAVSKRTHSAEGIFHFKLQNAGLELISRNDQRAIGLWSNRIIRRDGHGFNLDVVLSVSRNLMRGIRERMFLETITASTSAKSHFINISLVYWEAFTHRQAKFIINTAKTFSVQHGTNKNERAASSALMALPFSQCQLPLDIPFSEVNKIKSSELTRQMDHETSFPKDPKRVDVRFI
jgi:hypothetical protein